MVVFIVVFMWLSVKKETFDGTLKLRTSNKCVLRVLHRQVESSKDELHIFWKKKKWIQSQIFFLDLNTKGDLK